MSKESDQSQRCPWSLKHPMMIKYHDEEWGVPCYDDQRLFEFLVLSSTQAGLSWKTVLQKREAYQRAFDHFHIEKIAGYNERKINTLLTNPGIIRNRLKIVSAIVNAKAVVRLQQKYGSFHQYLWEFVEGQTHDHKIMPGQHAPCLSPESEKMSNDMQRRGFQFVGPKICYSLMQSVGMVNDHEITCFRYREIVDRRARF